MSPWPRPEEMPVNETLTLQDALRDDDRARDRRSSSATACCPSASAAAEAAQARRGARRTRDPRRALTPTRERAAQRLQLRRLRRRARAAVTTLPHVFEDDDRAGRAPGARAGRCAVRARVRDKRIIVCAGSGGVGKTTTSAALAMGLAAEGARVAVVTIDPARRLANALGVDELGNEPHLVDPERLAGHGIEVRGELWAMMLDAKRTFDELIELLAPDERTRDEVLSNRIYQQLSGAVAGSQEFTAVAKLYELDKSGRFDVLVLDTPPSRNALDFLDAPDRLHGLPRGSRAARASWRRPGLAARVVGRGTSVVFSRPQAPDRRRSARRPQRLLPRAGRPASTASRSAPRASRRCWPTRRRRSSSSPRPSASRSRRRSSSPASCATRACRSAVSSSTACTCSTAGRPRPTSRRWPPRWAATPSSRARSRAPTPRSARWRSATARRSSISARETGEQDPIVIPQLDGDVHDVDGLVAIHGHLFAD